MRRIRLLVAVTVAVGVMMALTVAVRAYATFAKWGSSPVLFYVNPVNADGLSPSSVQAALSGRHERVERATRFAVRV